MSETYPDASFDWLENERTQGNGSVPCCQPGLECSSNEGGSRTMDILNEMKRLHEERLRRIEQEAGRDSAELKVKALESWVGDLEEQNTMLVQILGKLEQEAGDRVSLLKEKLNASATATTKFMESEQDRDKLISQLTEENQQLQNTVVQFINKHEELQGHIASQYEQHLGKMYGRTQRLQSTSNKDLEESVQALILCFDEVLQERQQLLQEAETLKSELTSKVTEIEDLNKKVLIMDTSARDMREALAVEVADKHDQIISLRREIHHLEDRCRQADMQTHFKDDIIKEMRKDLKTAKSRLAALESQKHSIFVNDREHEGDTETHKIRSHNEQRTSVISKHNYRSNPLSFIPELSEISRIEDIYYEIRRRDAQKNESAANSNAKNIGTQLEGKQMPVEVSCCKEIKEVAVGTEDMTNTAAESNVVPKLSVKEIYNYRHSVREQQEDPHRRLRAEDTDVQVIQIRPNFENSSTSEEDASLAAFHLKLRSTQNLVTALKDRTQIYVEELRIAEQNQADSERRIRELKSILEMSQHQIKTTLERASDVDMTIPYVQEVQKYNEGSQEAFKNMRAEIHFLLFNLRSRAEKSSQFEESVSALELSLEQLQDNLMDIQNIVDVNTKLRYDLQDNGHHVPAIKMVENGFKISEEDICTCHTPEKTSRSAIHAQSAPNQGSFEKCDKQAEELQKELNRSKEEQMRYQHQIKELGEEIASLHGRVAEVDILQETLFRMKSELETVTFSLDAKEQIVKDQEQVINILQDSVNTAEKGQAELLCRLNTLENEKEKAMSELEEVEKKAENLQEALLATKKQLQELQGSKFELRIRDCIIQFLHLDLSEVQTQYENCYGEVVKQEKMLDSLQYSNDDLQFEVVNLEQDIGHLEHCLREKLRSINNIKEHAQELEKKLKERDEQLLMQKYEFEKLTLAANEKNKTIENLQENLIHKDQDLKQMKHLEEQYVNMKMKADALCDSVLKLETLNAGLKEEMKKHENEERALRMQLPNVQQENIQKSEVIEKLAAELSDLKYALQSNESELLMLREKYRCICETCQILRDSDKALRMELQDLQCKNVQKSEMIEKLNAELSDLKYASEAKESEILTFREKYSCLCKTCQKLQDNLAIKEKMILDLQSAICEGNTKIMNLVLDVENKEAKIAKQQTSIKALKDEVEDKSTWAKIAELTKETTLLKAEIAHLREQNEKMNLEICCLTNRVTALTFELDDTRNRLAATQEGNKLLINMKKQLLKQIKELENELTAMQETAYGEHDMVCVESRNTIMKARRWIEELKRENDELRARFQEQKQMCSSLMREYHNLKMKVKNLKQVNLMLKKSAQACNVLLTALPGVDESDTSGFMYPIAQAAGYAKGMKSDIKAENEAEIPSNIIKNLHAATDQRENGKIYDKKPFKFTCTKDKDYFWCLCGQSKNQPFCDGTHRNPHLQIKQRPIKFRVAETKEYWLCNCKQTSNRPFCDGTHKRDDIQAAVKH